MLKPPFGVGFVYVSAATGLQTGVIIPTLLPDAPHSI